MTKEQFNQLYALMEKVLQEIQASKYVCNGCMAQATVTEEGATKPCACEAPIVVNMESKMYIKGNLTN
jgi:hypothetical protein